MEEIPPISFELQNWMLPTLSGKDSSGFLLQWNLDKSLRVKKFSFHGAQIVSGGDYERLVKDFFKDSSVRSMLSIDGIPIVPIKIQMVALTTKTLTMDFFDILTTEGVVTPSGNIRGCPDEIFDGVTTGDQLRELLVNPDSERSYIFGEDARKEFIFHLFKLIVVGGSMCQADASISRYLDVTKGLYKDLLTVYRDSEGITKVATKVFLVSAIQGCEVFPHPENGTNSLMLVIDPVKKCLIVIKNEYLPYW